jgi:CheY-like chemotaxis protein
MPIIALSANVMAEVIEKCVSAGFNSYVTKPVDFKMLSSEMAKFLDRDDPTRPHKLMRARS